VVNTRVEGEALQMASIEMGNLVVHELRKRVVLDSLPWEHRFPRRRSEQKFLGHAQEEDDSFHPHPQTQTSKRRHEGVLEQIEP